MGTRFLWLFVRGVGFMFVSLMFVSLCGLVIGCFVMDALGGDMTTFVEIFVLFLSAIVSAGCCYLTRPNEHFLFLWEMPIYYLGIAFTTGAWILALVPGDRFRLEFVDPWVAHVMLFSLIWVFAEGLLELFRFGDKNMDDFGCSTQ